MIHCICLFLDLYLNPKIRYIRLLSQRMLHNFLFVSVLFPEKKSILSKIFGRKKKDRDKALMPPPPAPPPILHPPAPPSSTSESDVHSEGREPKEKEYATFSAQFPPPEWMWYQQQLEKQKRTENWVTHQTSKASTAVDGLRTASATGAKVTSRPPVPARTPHHYAPSHRKSLISLHHGHENYVPMAAVPAGGVYQNPYGPDVVRVGGTQSIRPDNLYESFRSTLPPALPKSRDHHHRKSRDFDSRRVHVPHQHHRHTQEHRQSEYDVIDNPGDVTPHQTSNVYHSVSALSPVIPWNDNDSSTYAKLIKQQPQLGPLHSTPRVNLTGQTERTAYGVEGHETRDRIYGPTSHGHHRQRTGKSHRSRRKAQRIYSYYTGGGGAGSDISYEYKGKLPNKNSSRAQSRDSGVNCVGLAKAKGQTDPVYENTDKSKQQKNRPNQEAKEKESLPNHVHFKRADGGEAEGESISHPGLTATFAGDTSNQAYNSVVYGGDTTNQAYNSVVYGSMMEGPPSVMYGTIATSQMNGSEVALHKNSLQSGYYNDDEDSSVPASTLIRCQVEINPTAHVQEGEELHSSPDSLVDVVGQTSPGVREVSGSSDGVLELAAGGEEEHGSDKEKDPESSDDGDNVGLIQYVGRTGVEHDGDDEHTEEDGEGYDTNSPYPRHNSFSEQCVAVAHKVDNVHLKSNQPNNDHEGISSPKVPLIPLPPSNKPSSSNSCIVSREQFVSDSGFSSPRNPEGASSNVNGNHVNSFGQDGKKSWPHVHTESLSAPHHHHQIADEETVGSSDGGHHTNSSDVNMASSEHHSGSTTNGDSSCDTQPHSYPSTQPSHKASQNMPHSSPSSAQSAGLLQQGPPVKYIQSQHQHPQNVIRMYQPSAMVVPHPDVYNNNSSNIIHNHAPLYIEQSPLMHVPLQPNTAVINGQPEPSLSGKAVLSERDLWKQNNTPDELHKFEEEQLAKKYGVNGEFEVMGVL